LQELLEESRVFAGLNYRRSRIEEKFDMNKDSKVQDLPLETPTDLASKATEDIAASLTTLLADVFALYLKTKNFHWHMSGRHFRDYHLLLDEQGDQIFAMTDPMAERVRKIGGRTLRSIGQISLLQRILDNDAG
jgi:starvation-inducible DNA-binding protein